jgi:hypothetical protein
LPPLDRAGEFTLMLSPCPYYLTLLDTRTTIKKTDYQILGHDCVRWPVNYDYDTPLAEREIPSHTMRTMHPAFQKAQSRFSSIKKDIHGQTTMTNHHG